MFKTHAHRTMDMTEGSLLTKVLFFSLPIMLSGILQLLFNAADTIVVGRFAGNEALAAVGSVGSLNNMIISLFVGLSIGVNVLVARFTGAKDAERVSETVHTAVLLSLVGGAVLAVVGFVAARPLLEIMGSPEDVIDLAELYIRIIFVGMPVQMLYNFCAAVLRAVGDTKRPLYFLTIAGVINAGLNLVFVIGFKMSVAGVALATIISQAVSAVLVTRSLMLMDGPTRLHLNRLSIKPHIMRMIIQIGLPAGIQSCMFSLSNVVIQSSVNSFGSIVIAGNAAGANVGNFVYQAMNTFQQAVTCFAGQNIGARKPRRVLTSMYVSLFWAFSFGVVFGVLSCVFGTQLPVFHRPGGHSGRSEPHVYRLRPVFPLRHYGRDDRRAARRGLFAAADDRFADGRVRVPHFLGHDGVRGEPHDGLPDGLLPRFVDADVLRAGRHFRRALEEKDQAALHAGRTGGAVSSFSCP